MAKFFCSAGVSEFSNGLSNSLSRDQSMEAFNSCCFKFEVQELPQKLSQISKEPRTGYWLFEFANLNEPTGATHWYLGLLQGRVIVSGSQPCPGANLLETLQRYTPRLRNLDIKKLSLHLTKQLNSTEQKSELTSLSNLLDELDTLNLLNLEEVESSLWLKTLASLDIYLFNYSGQAQFFPCSQPDAELPITGFDIETLLQKAKERKAWWQKLPISIAAMESLPVLNTEVLESSRLTVEQRQRLKSLVSSGKTLNEIAVDLAQDPLEIAKIFARLVSENLVTLRSLVDTPTADVVIVDDSPLLLKQFENLVTAWGYTVQLFSDPAIALKTLPFVKPSVVFLDVNMPEITGFDLVKQIRRQPTLSNVPVIMLTAEKTLANNWKARWSGCQFLSKPLASNEIPQFRTELQMLLTELVALPRGA